MLTLYLKNKSLDLYDSQGKNLITITFPPEAVLNEEIVDRSTYEKLLAMNLVKANPKRDKVIVLLADSLLYQKSVPLPKPEEEKGIEQQFFDEVPFDNYKIAKIEIRTDKELKMIATNKELYQPIVNVFEGIRISVPAVVPSCLLENFGAKDMLTAEDIVQVEKLVASSKIPPFYSDDLSVEGAAAIKTKENRAKILKILALVLMPVFSLSVLGFSLYITGMLPFLPKKSEPQPPETTSVENVKAVAPSPVPSKPVESTKSAEVAPLVDKAQLKVRVLNGTGVSGQAGRVKEAMEGIGFKTISTGNADSTDNIDTTVTVTDKIPEVMRKEIQTAMEKVFAKVSIKQGQPEGGYDILIVSGDYK